MDPESYPITPKRGNQGRSSGTYYINSRKNFYRPRDELVDINFYNENIAADDEKFPSRKLCCCVCVLVALLVLLAAAAFVILTGVFHPSPLGSHCVNATDVIISEFDKFAEKYKKNYNESEVCSRLETFASNFAKYENGSIKVENATFGITTFADWTEEERRLAAKEKLANFGDVNPAEKTIGAAMTYQPNKTWNVDGFASSIHFDDSKSAEENIVNGLLQWHQWWRVHGGEDSTIAMDFGADDNATISEIKLVGDYSEFEKKLAYFNNWGAFASNILVPYDFRDYQEGVISECDEGNHVSIVQGIICGYGQINGSYYWEVQPIGSSWQSWGMNGTALISADESCSLDVMFNTAHNIYSIKKTSA